MSSNRPALCGCGGAGATAFLCGHVDPQGKLLWDRNETTTAEHNPWTYTITYNVLRRICGARNEKPARRPLGGLLAQRTASGLLPMRDRGEAITECAFMQADMLLFLLTFSGLA